MSFEEGFEEIEGDIDEKLSKESILEENGNLKGLEGLIEVAISHYENEEKPTYEKKETNEEVATEHVEEKLDERVMGAGLEEPQETVILRGKKLTPAQIDAYKYLDRKKIDDLFAFMMGHILCKIPDDPYSFLIKLLEDCLEFRDGEGDPPLLFNPEHQDIVYRGMDPGNLGVITYEQYCNGMKTMGIKNFNKTPIKTEEGMIRKKDFLDEADKCLIDHLYSILSPKIVIDDSDVVLLKSEGDSVKSSEFSIGSGAMTSSMGSQSLD